ncbi:MAG: tRNA (cytidine(56)-2'-O)-methyltransferase [Candidatus Micrarchaeota archaeon]
MKISVLRLGHRKNRDIRVTTHCCLVARAFLADEIILSGEEDAGIIETVRKVSQNWGGKLKLRYEPNYRKFLQTRKKKGQLIVHLTMYGEHLAKKLAKIRKLAINKGIVVVIGAEKVPPEIYRIADFNIAITGQPHSEVAALAIFLNRLQQDAPLSPTAQKRFKNARIIITPGEKGKKIKKN